MVLYIHTTPKKSRKSPFNHVEVIDYIVDILCRPGPSTVLTSEDDRGIRRWGADLVVALLHVPTKARGPGGMVSQDMFAICML